MSALPYYVKRVKYMTVGLGVFMMLSSVFMLVFVGTYMLSLLISAVFMLAGIFGVVAGSRIRPRSDIAYPTGQPVLVEVRCRSCSGLNLEGSKFCSTCGAQF